MSWTNYLMSDWSCHWGPANVACERLGPFFLSSSVSVIHVPLSHNRLVPLVCCLCYLFPCCCRHLNLLHSWKTNWMLHIKIIIYVWTKDWLWLSSIPTPYMQICEIKPLCRAKKSILVEYSKQTMQFVWNALKWIIILSSFLSSFTSHNNSWHIKNHASKSITSMLKISLPGEESPCAISRRRWTWRGDKCRFRLPKWQSSSS